MTKQTEVVKNITSLGFDTFEQSAQINSLNNLPGTFFEKFINKTLNTIKVNPELIPKIEEYLFDLRNTDPNVWNMYRTMFSVSNSSNANYLCIMTYRNEQD